MNGGLGRLSVPDEIVQTLHYPTQSVALTSIPRR